MGTSVRPPAGTEGAPPPAELRPPRRPPRDRGSVAAYAWAVAVVGLATAAASAARTLLHVPDVEMLFLLGVTVVAVTTDRGPAILASVLSVAAYDFFFVAPSFAFEVEDARYVLTFVMMLGIGVVISTLALRLREQQHAATDREERTSALYAVSRRLGATLGPSDVAAVCADTAAAVLGAPSVLSAPGDADELAPLAAIPPGTTLSPAERAVAQWTYLHGSAAGRGTATFDEVPVLCVPLRPLVEVLAVLVVRLPAGAPLRGDQRDFVDALCRQGALALERVRLADQARQAALRAETEAQRSALLSAVSHDLRTPLAAITGAATTLRADGSLDAETRRELLEAVCDEAERLERLVGNLLDMTRLESGAVQPRREWVPLVEVLGGALTRLDRALSERRVTTSIPDDLPLLSVDPVLLEQLFLNVLENATKYTPRGSPIDVSASRGDGTIAIEVSDRGPGIPEGAEERIFERFRRGPQAAGVGGAGLGLAIARAIAHVHGGTLVAAPRTGGGAVFRVTLPLAEPPPAEPEPEEPA